MSDDRPRAGGVTPERSHLDGTPNPIRAPRGSTVDYEHLRAVYEQYWKHARHNEHQLWLFTRVWALILTGIFAVLASGEATIRMKLAVASFGVVLSLSGFSLVYALRMPFLIYFWTVDLISREEFNVPSKYLRLNDGDGHKLGKRVTTSLVLFVAYAAVTVLLLVVSTLLVVVFVADWRGPFEAYIVSKIGIGVVAVAGLMLTTYTHRVKREFESVCDIAAFNEEDTGTDGSVG